MGPLQGVKVVEIASIGPGPWCAMMLSDMGAEVIRVDRADHVRNYVDGQPSVDFVIRRGRRSIGVDLKNPAGVEVVLRLVEQADALIEGSRPGVAERLGIGPDECLQRNPRLVYGRMTGWGQEGPLSASPGHDLNYLAITGLLHAIGPAQGRPVPPLNLVGDYGGGGMLLAFGIVSGLLEASRLQRGQVIDAAMVDGVALLTARLQGLRAAGLFGDEPGTNWIDSGAPCYDTYRCADGRYIAVGALEPDFYREFISRLGVDVAGGPDQDDRAAWPRLRELIAAAVAARPQAEWAGIYEGTDACVTPVLTFDEAARHPHNAERGVFERVGSVLHPFPAPRFSRTPARPPAAPGSGPVDVDQLIEAWSPRPCPTVPRRRFP